MTVIEIGNVTEAPIVTDHSESTCESDCEIVTDNGRHVIVAAREIAVVNSRRNPARPMRCHAMTPPKLLTASLTSLNGSQPPLTMNQTW